MYAKDLFIRGTGAIMTGCSSYHHQWPLLEIKLIPGLLSQTL